MKKKILLTILTILMCVFTLSCTSCTSNSSAATPAISPIPTVYKPVVLKQDTSKLSKSDKNQNAIIKSQKEIIENQNTILLNQDSIKKMQIQDIIDKKEKIVKEVKPIVIDNAWQVSKNVQYQRLEKSKKMIQGQQKTIDSMMIIRRKKK
jgi:hypothetical protein